MVVSSSGYRDMHPTAIVAALRMNRRSLAVAEDKRFNRASLIVAG
jgi:lambda repressor-like predicted transcriptional regulator